MTAAGRSPLEPLLETWEDPSVSPGEQTDAYLTLTSRMTGQEGKEVITEIEKNLPRLYTVLKAHISSQNAELSSAALQALGFCLYNPKITSGLSEANIQELLLTLNGIIKSSDKNVCTRALWVISKQTFPTELVSKMVSSIIDSLEVILSKGEVHSAVVDFEALNVIIRLIEQTPVQMGEESVRWAKLVIPLVVHSAQKVHLRGATALEMGMPLLLQKQQEIALITEHLMTTKLISELQKLFMSKNETYVLKLWPLFVKLLGKTLHRSGSFINSLLQLEELGFRSGTPMIKKIAFIAWKSLIDNFALNPDILCSAKRLKLLMQPLSSIHVRTETLALTKLEVWWYLLMRLGPQLPGNFEQVCVPLIQSTISVDSVASPQGSSSRGSASPVLSPLTPGHKGASYPATPRMNQSSSIGGVASIPSIQLLGLEMMLHFLLGPEVLNFAKQHKLVLSLEPLEHPLISSPSFFSKHANVLITAVHDSFVAVGRDASDAVVSAIWKELISLVKSVTESGNKERSGSEVLTLLLKSLENIVKSEVFPVSKTLVLMEITVKGLPQKVLGSPAYQVANMDILNGTPALFLIQLIFSNNLLECGVADEKFFLNLETLVGCVLSGPTSPLAFSDSVLSVINQNAKHLANKEHLWRMWSIIVTPLTDRIHQTNEVNQGDALEHNFSAIYGALTLPINHVFSAQTFPMATMKTLLKTWSELYRAFARCAALVATAEENLCCEELCSKILCSVEDEILSDLLFLDRISQVINVMVDCIDFSPYNIKYQPKIKSPQRSSDWSRKKKEPLGKLTSLFKLIVRVIHSFHTLSIKETYSDTLLTIGNSVISMLSNIFGHISLPSMIREIFATFTRPLALLYENSKLDEVPKVYNSLNNKLEKLLGEIIACLQYNYPGAYDSELLGQLSPLLCIVFLHKNKQIRKQSALLWNATFAKATALVYPEELKPILRQAKQKILLLLPGLENVEMMDESSGPYSDATENSQLNVKISGMERKSSGKRDSFLAQTKDKKENMKLSTKLKVESSSPKLKSSNKLLEEEKSTDFVFIPPQGKEGKARILTEHQKEVLKTKRCDIPALYNNLDVSQDTLFSAQFSQEESMESLTLTEKPKEDAKIIKEEQMESAIFISQDAMENSCVDEHPEKASLPNDSGSVAETNSETLSAGIDDTKNMLISSKIMSAEYSSGTESSLVVSNSSVYNATVSGTPSQPTSRRQTFITLEKYDGSENRPFSPSPLNSMSSTVTVRNNQENTTKTDMLPKARKREVTHSKSDSEKLVNGGKKSGRRWSKVEQSTNKKSKPSLRSEQEEHALENNPPDLLSQTECLSNHDHPSGATLEHEDRNPKPTGENASLEDSTTEEKNVGINMESKENTPPVAAPADQIVNEESQAVVAPNPKTLRRSSRRRPEIVESSNDSQDKDNGQQKKERRKEEEKTVTKSPLHIKDDKLPKQKLTAESSIQENLTEKGNSLHEKTLEEPSANAEIDQNKRKPDHENISSEGGSTQDNVDKSSEKPLRGRTRYQTRRASQGLLSELSEPDSSESKEEVSRKKRSGKWKNKSSDSVDIEEQEEKMVEEECVKTAHEIHEGQAVPEALVDAVAQICEESTNRVILQESAGSSDSLQVTDTPVTGEDTSKTSKCVDNSFASPPVPESNLRTRNATKRLYKRDTDSSVGECSKMETADISVPSEKWAQAVECQHKRSRRVRRSKSCDCCGGKWQSQEKSLTGLKNTESCAIKSMETKTAGMRAPELTPDTGEANEHAETKLVDEHASMHFHLGLKEENGAPGDLVKSETGLEEDRKKVVPSEIGNMKEKSQDTDSSEIVSEIQEPGNEKFTAEDPCLRDSKDISQRSSLDNKVESPDAVLKRESDIGDVRKACKVITGSSSEGGEAMELDGGNDSLGAAFSEKSAHMDIPVDVTAEEDNKKDEFEAVTAEVNAEGAATKGFNSALSLCDHATPVSKSVESEHSARVDLEDGVQSDSARADLEDGVQSDSARADLEDGVQSDSARADLEDGVQSDSSRADLEDGVQSGSAKADLEDGVQSDCGSCEEMNTETESSKAAVVAQLKMEVGDTGEEDRGTIVSTSTSEETPGGRPGVKTESFVCDTLEMSSEEGTVCYKTETNIELKLVETKLSDNQNVVNNDVLQEVCLTSEKVEELPQSLTSEVASELVGENSNASPEKLRELDPSLGSANESPSGMQARCVWSPLASPSTSILKRGLKRAHEDEISSPVNKVRRVSFADPIYQAGLADDIDRRCSVVRSHSSNSSPIIKSVKTSPTSHSKHNTTSAKGFLSPGSQSSKFKSSKKCLITEMAKESMLSPTTESVYPALVNCAASVDIILPQITSNMWARGLGQLIRAKNIKTIGDLSTLTASEIKTLPIRSPKVFNVKKALRVYHEQQMKSRGLEEIPVFDISEKAVNGVESKPLSTDEERLASDLIDPVTVDTPLSKNLVAQISALALQLDSEDLYSYSGSQLFEMHEKLGTMANSIIRNLQSRWRSPVHENS
ncbi:telomere-associated protein RIF1 isoform X1 [Peromyscus californicus insignis]|uniref:telomere-associated protein RIF1 isoform X1 n=1 Tax=Peromyscus californicus insignis TaxID=564181 RepID=UPI0022A800D8|nr:telomere-associated protein RIF1 isoform X1 [Peromyscus californicus insignis]XP_052579373.1 telomere-associated protein RIF1 isoform X1 [Peromyscus californicus insignis]